MPLQGTFDVLDFSAVLDILADRKMTGRLHVRSRSFTANLFLADGALVGADQSEHQAAAMAGDVRQRVQEVCFELLDTDRGTFEFFPGRSAAPMGETVMSVAEAMEQARQRLDEWQELQQLLPSLDVQPHMVTELDPGQVTLDRDQWRVLTAIDGRRNLRSIGRALNLSDFEVCKAIRDLLSSQVIELDAHPPGMSGFSEIESPLATEHVTINGKRATRVRSGNGRRTSEPETEGDNELREQTIVISAARSGQAVSPAPVSQAARQSPGGDEPPEPGAGRALPGQRQAAAPAREPDLDLEAESQD